MASTPAAGFFSGTSSTTPPCQLGKSSPCQRTMRPPTVETTARYRGVTTSTSRGVPWFTRRRAAAGVVISPSAAISAAGSRPGCGVPALGLDPGRRRLVPGRCGRGVRRVGQGAVRGPGGRPRRLAVEPFHQHLRTDENDEDQGEGGEHAPIHGRFLRGSGKGARTAQRYGRNRRREARGRSRPDAKGGSAPGAGRSTRSRAAARGCAGPPGRRRNRSGGIDTSTAAAARPDADTRRSTGMANAT